MKFFNKLKALFANQTFITISLTIALAISATLCATQVTRFIQSRHQPAALEVMPTEIAAVAAPEPSQTPLPKATPKPQSTVPAVTLSASSSEEDLNVRLLDESGAAVTGAEYIIQVTAENEKTPKTYHTDTEGTMYIEYITAGNYKIEFPAQGGFKAAAPVMCAVKPHMQREAVEVIEPVTTIQQAAQETKTVSSTYGEIEIGDIDSLTEYTAAGEYSSSETVSVSNNTDNAIIEISIPEPEAKPEPEAPSYDSPGIAHTVSNTDYIYTIFTDDNGYLFNKGGESVSEVLLIEEGYNVVYGLKSIEGSSESIELISNDGTVNEEFQIFAAENLEPEITPTPEPTPIVKVGWQEEDGRRYFYDRNENRITGLNRIDGKLYFFAPDGACASRLGIDVSFFNGTIDWNAVKADGIDFAIIRVGGRGWSSGLLYDDTMSYENLANAKAAGLKIGVYFYSTAINVEEAIQEASLAIQNLHGIGLDFPIYFDTEHSGEYPVGRSDMLTPDQQTEIAKAFCDTVQNSGYRAGVYSGLYYYYSDINYAALSGYNIWLANYTRNYALPNFAGRYDMWQFTDSGRVNGIHGYVDMNVIF